MSDPNALLDIRPPSFIEQVETAMVEALKEGVEGGVKVEAFPADTRAYDFAGLNAAALVHYKGANFTQRESHHSGNQKRRMNFSVLLLTRSLRGQNGAYHALEDIRLALQGEAFAGAGPAEIVSDGLIFEDQGEWRWEIVIGLNAPAVARNRVKPAGLMQRPTTETIIPGRNGAV